MHIPPIHGVIAIAMGKNAFEKGERKTTAASRGINNMWPRVGWQIWVAEFQPLSFLRDQPTAFTKTWKSCLGTYYNRMRNFVHIITSHGRGGRDDRDRMSPIAAMSFHPRIAESRLTPRRPPAIERANSCAAKAKASSNTWP